MKRKGNILFRIIFLLIVFINAGIVAFSNTNIPFNSIELTSDENSFEYGFSSDDDLVIDDQTDQTCTNWLAEQPVLQMGIRPDYPSPLNFCLSVWHPPKIS